MGFSAKNLSLFYTQMGTMLKAGLSIQSVMMNLSQTAPPSMRPAVTQMSKVIQGGEPLHQAMTSSTQFSLLDQEIIGICERSGALETALLSLGHYYEQYSQARSRFLAACIIPGALLVLSVFIVPFPKLVLGFLGQSNYGILNYLGDVAVPFLILFAVAFGVYFLIKALLHSPKTSVTTDRFLNAIPILGTFRSSYALCQWLQVIRLMLKAGYGVLQAIDLSCKTKISPSIADGCARARPLMNTQMNVSQSLAASGAFPSMLVQLWSTGEESGQMDEMLDKLVAHYEETWKRNLLILASVLPWIVYGLVSIYIIIQIFKAFMVYLNAINSAVDGNF